MNRSANTWMAYVFRLAASVLAAQLVCGQEFRGNLSGQVTDPSAGVVPNATVQAVNRDTQQTYTAVTSSAGGYYIPYILPGTYTVDVTAAGFKTQVQNNVVLQAGESPVLNFKLEVGATNQTVEVSAAAPLLDAENAVQANVLTTREIENVPLNGRQVYMLLGTTPGSQFLQTQFGAQGYSGTRAWDVSNNYTLGGGVQGYQQFTLNGTNITMQNNGANGTWELAPNVDALQEVNVQTTNYDARYGRSGGGIVNMVMKSGTNQYHGDAYDYFENGDLNANNFENNLNGVARQNVHQNQFGGTFGGPVKKDKVFFFGSYEGYKETIPFTTVTSVPPAYLRPQPGQGVNFTQTGFTIYDPLTTFCTTPGQTISNCTGSLLRLPFPNDTIPANRISSIGAAILNLYPLPNTNSGGLQNNYIANAPDKYFYQQPMVRVDYDTSDKTRWY
ncbi:MAG: carboxypeptidase regulatory-like domain-containing protein, partial [Acidobacteria bacterium]|nr:carboxypeptidase regulatory-like domain-containing protein [Acidobacteriota bacterium]